MRETERVRMMERMRDKVRQRERKMMEGLKERYERDATRKRDMKQKMAFVALNSLHLTIFCLLDSSRRVSIDPRNQEFLIFAAHGVNEAVELLKSLEIFRAHIESKRIEALEGEISEAAWKLENVLDSHVSDQFLSQSETESIQLAEDERQTLLFFLNLQGIEQDIDGFIQTVMKMEKLLNPWLEEEEEEEEDDDDDDGDVKESNILGLSNQSEVDVIITLFIRWLPEADSFHDGHGGGKYSDIIRLSGRSEVHATRNWFISWFASKAASIFLGIKEEYIQELEKLLPQEEENDDYSALFTIDFTRMVSVDRDDYAASMALCEIKGSLMIWWINKAAFFIMGTDFTQQLINPLPKDAAANVVVSSGTEFDVNMIGSTDLFCKIRDYLLQDFKGLRISTIVGMAGIGKTAIAKKIIKDPLISSKFECCIFVRLGPEYEWEETLQAILAQIPDGDKMLMEEDVDLRYSVSKTLKDRKCLLVLDDFWNRGPWDISNIFPEGGSQSAILFTTRIGIINFSCFGRYYHVPFLNNEESWDLLCSKIFGEKRCPPQLEKAGKMIAENCEGLPLLILVVADLLSQAEKTPEYWSEVATKKTHSIFVDAYEKVSDVVYPSYYYLPQYLKACFLYLGAFPQNDEVRVSRLIVLWSVDGFLGVPYTRLEEDVCELLSVMVSNNVFMETQKSNDPYRVKALTLHSVFWYLCKTEARKEKFLNVLYSYTDASTEGIKCQRCLSIINNTIFIIKDVCDSIVSIPALHSLLCTGSYHQYQVPICLGLRLLKILDTLTIRFYEFPVEVVKLFQIRYLALTCNGNLPPSISNLWGLQCLILHQHQSIKSSIVSHSYLPVEIWDLKNLEHLQIMGRNLPEPPPGAVLRKLLRLLDVGAHTCTKHVLASIPNLKKLRVQNELMPVATEPLRFCDDTSHLKELRSVQFVVVNPELNFEIVVPELMHVAAGFGSYSSLKNLTLSGFGYPWKDMNKIAKLPCLEVLKLKCYAFRGEKWQVRKGEFYSLKYLSVEDTDLVQWTGYFQGLQYLTIKNCYRLLELPNISYPRKIWVVDCNPSAVACAKQKEDGYCHIHIDSSWLSHGKTFISRVREGWDL